MAAPFALFDSTLPLEANPLEQQYDAIMHTVQAQCLIPPSPSMETLPPLATHEECAQEIEKINTFFDKAKTAQLAGSKRPRE